MSANWLAGASGGQFVFEQIDYKFRLWKAQRTQRRVNREYSDDIRRARAQNKPGDDIESMISEAMHEADMASEEIGFMVTQYLRQECEKHFLPFPSRTAAGMWEEGRNYRRWYLTPAGIVQARATVRKEKSERHGEWLPWLAGITGLVGALTGLLAVFVSK